MSVEEASTGGGVDGLDPFFKHCIKHANRCFRYGERAAHGGQGDGVQRITKIAARDAPGLEYGGVSASQCDVTQVGEAFKSAIRNSPPQMVPSVP